MFAAFPDSPSVSIPLANFHLLPFPAKNLTMSTIELRSSELF